MSNGIDNIYETSDVTRKLAEIEQERKQLIEDKHKKREDIIKTGASIFDYWSTEQRGKTQELLALKDQGKEVFEMSPEYMEKSGLKRAFTPAHKRVSPIQATRTETQMVAPETPGTGSPEFVPKEVTITEPRAAEYLKAHPQLQDPKTIGKTVSKGAKDISESSEKFFGTDLGQWLSIASAGKGIVDIFNPDFKKRSGTSQGLSIGSTAASVGSLLDPAAKLLGAPLGLWGAGFSLLSLLSKR